MAWVLSSDGVREASFPTALPRNDLARLVDAYRDALIKLNPNAAGIGDQIGKLLLAPLGIEAGHLPGGELGHGFSTCRRGCLSSALKTSALVPSFEGRKK